MLRHIVFFKFHDDVRESALEEAPKLLYGLVDGIEVIRSMEIGKDILRRGHSFDLALTVTFDSLDAYLTYDTHPLHLVVKKYNQTVCKEIVAVDYEFN